MIINTDLIYPIGSIYMNINLVNPGKLFGGTWERIEARYLMGAGKPSKNSYDGFGQITDSQCTNLDFAPATLGEITHTLTSQEMPRHSHGGLNWAGRPFSINSGTTCIQLTAQSWSTGDANANYWGTGETGGSSAHNNLPPTLVVYIWKRTA